MKHPYQPLITSGIRWLRQSIGFLWMIAIAVYLIVLAGNAMYRTYQAQQDTLAIEQKLKKAQQEKARLEALLVYYQTDSFKEKELRRTLLMKRPNEKVYALPESSASKTVEEDAAQNTQNTVKKTASSLPIWRQWTTYLLTGER